MSVFKLEQTKLILNLEVQNMTFMTDTFFWEDFISH